MFVDKATVSIEAGKGGDGAVSFRHEKYIDKGGPDGGDGGKGGDVIAVASLNQNTLANYRHNRLLTAKPGGNGSKRRKHGKNGSDLIVNVPVGTAIYDEKGQLIVDLTEDGQRAVIAAGGRGGFGNAHFVSSVRQTPRVAEKGEPGESLEAIFELKIIADVGLVGMPNAGKSTLLGSISNAKPEVADYPFTTLSPYLGVVDFDDSSFLVADIPGLIEGASQGKGLGDEFLRHVERTSVIWHLIDSYQEDVATVYQTISKELSSYKVDITKKPEIVVLTKIEGLDDEIINEKVKELKKVTKSPIVVISSVTKDGINKLLTTAIKAVNKSKAKLSKVKKEDEIPVIKLGQEKEKWEITHKGNLYTVKGRKIERFALRTDFTNDQALARLRDIMKKMGITHQLLRLGASAGSTIKIADKGEFIF